MIICVHDAPRPAHEEEQEREADAVAHDALWRVRRRRIGGQPTVVAGRAC